MTEETRTIALTPTWAEAMTIYCAALENGTGEGRAAARQELARVAEILDTLAEQLTVPRYVFEVIAGKPGSTPYGVTFTSEPAARAYANRLDAHGYEVDAVAEVTLTATTAEGLADAAGFFGEPALMEPST